MPQCYDWTKNAMWPLWRFVVSQIAKFFSQRQTIQKADIAMDVWSKLRKKDTPLQIQEALTRGIQILSGCSS
jgi:hypothetical protein